MNRNFNVYLKTVLMPAYVLLETEPIGLADYKNVLKRHPVYNSVFIDVTLDIKFVNDGYKYMKEAYDDYGHFATADVKINEYNSETNQYDTIFEGVADFSQYERTDVYISLPLDSSAKTQLIKSRDEIKYNLNSNVSTDNVTIGTLLPPASIQLPAFKFEGTAKVDKAATEIFNKNYVYAGSPIDPDVVVDTIEDYDYTVIENILGSSITATYTDGIFKAPSDGYFNDEGLFHIEVSGTLEWNLQNSGQGYYHDLFIEIYNVQNDSVVFLSPRIARITDGVTDNFTYQEDVQINNDNITILEGESIDYNIRLRNVFWNGGAYFSKLNIDTNGSALQGYELLFNQGELESLPTRAWYPYEAITRQIQLMTSELNVNNLFDSSLLGRKWSYPESYPNTGEWAGLMLINGKTMYNIGGQLNISFRDLFTSINAIEPIGFWYDKENDIFKLEKLNEFYQNTEIASFENVSNFTISVDKTKMYAIVTGGYDNAVSDEYVNGVFEFNTNMESSLPIKITKNVLNTVSVIRADTIGLNDKRFKYETNSISTGSKTDDNVFFVDSAPIDTSSVGIASVIKGSDIDLMEGVPHNEEWINVRITPKRNLIRQGLYFNPCLRDYYFSDTIKYVNGKSQNNLTTEVDGRLETEQGDLLAEDANQPNTWIEIYDFDVSVDLQTRKYIKANPHGYITVTNNDTTYSGFIIECDLNNNKNKGHFKLIRN